MLGPFSGPKPTLGQPKHFQTPSEALPDPFPCIKEATPHSAGPGQGGFEVLGGSLLDSIFGCYGLQVGGSGSKLEVWEALLGSILGPVGVWEAKRTQRRGLERLGLAQGWLGPANGPNMDSTLAKLEPTWVQHGSNLSLIEANLDPSWVQIG